MHYLVLQSFDLDLDEADSRNASWALHFVALCSMNLDPFTKRNNKQWQHKNEFPPDIKSLHIMEG